MFLMFMLILLYTPSAVSTLQNGERLGWVHVCSLTALEFSKLLKFKKNLNVKLEWEKFFRLKKDEEILALISTSIRPPFRVTASMSASIKSAIKKLRKKIRDSRSAFGIVQKVIFFFIYLFYQHVNSI